MKRSLFNRRFTQSLAWAGLVVLCGAIAIAQDAAPATSQRTDSQIEMDVVHALDAASTLKNDLITAATIQGEVTISGTVSSKESSKLAESIASHVEGVTAVHNNLKVGDPQAAPDAAENQPEETGATNPADASDQPAPAADGSMPPPAATDAADAQDQADAQAELRAQIRAEVIAEMQAQKQAQAQSNSAQNTPPAPPTPPPPPAYEAAKGPVTIPAGTLLQLRTSEPVNNKRAKVGQPVQFVVIHDVLSGGAIEIPRGATVHGVVTETKQAGDLAGSAELALKLTSLELGGQRYPLDTDQLKVKGPGKGESTAGHVVGGAIMGTILGCAIGRGAGCAIGAAAGAGAGVGASAATPSPNIWIPAEALVEFHLTTPLTVQPVSAQEAARLSQGLYPGGPNLYRRGYSPYGGYPYAYPPVYYHPYYVTGGYYYWR